MTAIANANFNPIGEWVNKLPLTPDNVLRALKAAGKA